MPNRLDRLARRRCREAALDQREIATIRNTPLSLCSDRSSIILDCTGDP
jgi:hypothetical protein